MRGNGLKVVSAAVLLNASSALACAVCGVGADQDQGAYLTMTIVMSLLPLSAIGAVVYWFVRQTRT